MDSTVIPTPGAQEYLPAAGEDAPSEGRPGDLTRELLETSFWSDDLVSRAGIPIIDVPFVTVGGGIGSFVLGRLPARSPACPPSRSRCSLLSTARGRPTST